MKITPEKATRARELVGEIRERWDELKGILTEGMNRHERERPKATLKGPYPRTTDGLATRKQLKIWFSKPRMTPRLPHARNAVRQLVRMDTALMKIASIPTTNNRKANNETHSTMQRHTPGGMGGYTRGNDRGQDVSVLPPRVQAQAD